MSATAGSLSPAQRMALHVGPGSGLPHDPLAFVLYGCGTAEPSAGFAVGQLDNVEIGACRRTLMLRPAPGEERLLTEASGSFGGLQPPTSVAVAAAGDVYAVDRATATLKYFDPCDCVFKPVPCFTRARVLPNSDCTPPPVRRAVPLNELSDPTGLAIAGTRLYVVDRGHHRVVVVSLVGMVPRAALRLPAASGLRHRWTPFAVAVDAHGQVHVSDPDSGRIDRFDAAGRWCGAWTSLGQATHLAVDDAGILLAVIADGGTDATGRRVPVAVEFVDGQPRPLDAAAAGLAHRLASRRIAVDRRGALHPGPLCEVPSGVAFWADGQPVADKDAVAASLYATTGTYLSTALDSRRLGCVWHRVVLAGTLPERAAIAIETTTSDVELEPGELADPLQRWSAPVRVREMKDGLADALVFSPPGRYLWLRLTLSGDGRDSPGIARIVVEFPRVSLRRYLPSVYGMDPLGADFTDRFTAIFDATLRSIESRIDTLHELFDPATAPAERTPRRPPERGAAIDFLTWIATWIGITLDRQWPEAVRRAFLEQARCTFAMRGTREGLRRLLLSLLGFDTRSCGGACPSDRCEPRPANCAPPGVPCQPERPPLILEHFRLRRWLFVGAGRLGDDATLWGERIVNRSRLGGPESRGGARVGPLECPPDRIDATQLISTPDPLRDPFHVYAHRFSVFVPARVQRNEWQRRGLERLLTQEAPAHTQWQIEYVAPRFRIGVQATIGLDSVIARVPDGVRLNDNALGRGTVLPPRPERPATVGLTTRVGESLRLN
ncbi:MAG: phage tail protein [Gammaproteobacteria bacterium]|nr:phage tail protein [Gammaproteobacteria bacterium]